MKVCSLFVMCAIKQSSHTFQFSLVCVSIKFTFEVQVRVLNYMEIVVRVDEYSSEIIDAGRKIKATTKSQYEKIDLEKKKKEKKSLVMTKPIVLDLRMISIKAMTAFY